ncbi:Ig-like domain-containing domain [Mangrovibacterium marinum]|uniref:Ig-like domain-containing protein n=1 Tax=Mangrovibacterium marinum TaxID=1639118 RepID=A0A2T5C2V3_9BACT|nr:Ig-like domain-containing domain [Mangrovibacterium marinum]PTN09045.1 Ig-like domain-containing protein [Mangrovibacterium marinum]
MKRFLLTAVLGYLGYLIFTTSCANPGMPTGGPKDSIPPVVVRTVPAFEARNYKGKTVAITFSEYIQSSDVAQQLVISPPVKKAPIIKTKSRTLILDFTDRLDTNKTYSLDFRNSIKDNNEGNPLRHFRFAFSNGPRLDSLTLGGYVRMAENMEPVLDALIVMHRLDSLSAFRDSIPDYVAKTDSDGFYQITNIAEGKYRLYALQDADNSMTYNSSDELIAFFDSLVVPVAPLQPDSVLTAHTHEGEESQQVHEAIRETMSRQRADLKPYYLLLFQENTFEQYLEDSKRDRNNFCQFFFQEGVSDSFSVRLINADPKPDYALFEYSAKRDTVNLWIRDTVISAMDTLQFQLNYVVLDSLQKRVFQTDTLELTYARPVEKERKRKKKDEEAEEEKPQVQHFSFKGNGKDGFDVYRQLSLTVPEPLEFFDYDQVHLFQKVDTVYQELNFDISRDSLDLRHYTIRYPWEFEQAYRLEIDSAAARSISGYPSNKLKQELKIKQEAFYAKIILTVTNLRGPSFIQLVKNTDKEEPVQQIAIRSDGEIEFPYLNPEKYKIKLVIDRNENGKWDTGDLAKGLQPERVVYFPKILKLRSNFEVRESWNLPDDLQFKKELIDEDQTEKDTKKKGGKTQRSSNRSTGMPR